MGFPRQGYWSGLPFPSPGHLPDQGSNLHLLHGQADSLPLGHLGSPVFVKHCVRSATNPRKHFPICLTSLVIYVQGNTNLPQSPGMLMRQQVPAQDSVKQRFRVKHGDQRQILSHWLFSRSHGWRGQLPGRQRAQNVPTLSSKNVPQGSFPPRWAHHLLWPHSLASHSWLRFQEVQTTSYQSSAVMQLTYLALFLFVLLLVVYLW